MNILDSSVILASFYKEKGGDILIALSKECKKNNESLFIHWINFIEVIYKVKKKLPNYDTRSLLAEFSSPWWGKLNYLDSDCMLLASELKAEFPQASLADCIGLATARIFKATFWTADQLLYKIGEKRQIKVNLIR